MDDVQLKDERGGVLILCAHDLEKGFVVMKTTGTLNSLNLHPDGARNVIGWLAQAFRLDAPATLEATDPAPILCITVPSATGQGEPREVSWSGRGEPPAWFADLAEIALTGELRRRGDDGAPGPHYREKVRRLLDALGVSHLNAAVDRVSALRDECDRSARALLEWAGVEPEAGGTSVSALIEKIKSRHRMELARQRNQLVNQYSDSRREGEVAAQRRLDAGLAQEREMRAAVNVELEATRAERDQLSEQLDTVRRTLHTVRQERDYLEEQLKESRAAVDERNQLLMEAQRERDEAKDQLARLRVAQARAREASGAMRKGLDEATAQLQGGAARLGIARDALVKVSQMDGVGPGAQGLIATALHQSDPNRA